MKNKGKKICTSSGEFLACSVIVGVYLKEIVNLLEGKKVNK